MAAPENKLEKVVFDLLGAQLSIEHDALNENHWSRPLPEDIVLHIASNVWAHKQIGIAIDTIQNLETALHDAINRPKGVVPDSAMDFYNDRSAQNDKAGPRRTIKDVSGCLQSRQNGQADSQ